MDIARFVTEVQVVDPDTQAPVDVAIYKLESNGAMFGVDSSYIVTLSDDDPVNCPFTGDEIQLIGD
ncbi:MAG: hypothetical protein CML22_06980 [Rheinheimera sp.]|nr:hypothetical protein [Rheinheimera sp.]MBM34027.1 hypothetical protein [Rheinheimera sp.]